MPNDSWIHIYKIYYLYKQKWSYLLNDLDILVLEIFNNGHDNTRNINMSIHARKIKNDTNLKFITMSAVCIQYKYITNQKFNLYLPSKIW